MSLVDVMPEIAEHIAAEDHAHLRRQLVAGTFSVQKGRWRPSTETAEPGYLGLLVISGLLTRDVVMHKPLATELVGRGDLLRLADADGADAPVPFDVAWQVIDPVQMAVLDAAFARRAAPWPSVIEFVLKAMTTRAHSLAVSMAISRLRYVDLRLLVLFWHLADRWGRVRPDGVHVPLQLTHESLARLIGARRPSVSTALRGLALEGRISRSPERHWILHGEPPATQYRVTGRRVDDGRGDTVAHDRAAPVDHHVADVKGEAGREIGIVPAAPAD